MIHVCEPYLDKQDLDYAIKAIKSGYISGSFGSYIKAFEARFAEYCNCKYGIATTNGTTALHLALASLGIKAGDEVIVSNLTNIATVYAIVYCGAKPVVVDCEERTWNIDPSKIERKITKRTKAMLIVHLYGHPVDMARIMRIKRKYGLYLVEDVAEAHGAEYKGRKTGSFGDMACFSFYANKIITTGEGGMVVTNSKKLFTMAQLLKDLAFSKKRRFVHSYVGYNYRMSNIQAAIGLAQLEKIDTILKKKIRMATTYGNLLRGIEGITLPPRMPWAKNVYWMYGILIGKKFGTSRDRLRIALKKKGIETRDFFFPMHRQPVFKKMGLFKNERSPVSDRLSREGLYLPSGATLKTSEIRYIGNTIKDIARRARRQ